MRKCIYRPNNKTLCRPNNKTLYQPPPPPELIRPANLKKKYAN
jgi:hypothetical protein